MKNSFGQFDEVSYVAFMEAALEHYDFQTCQRSDGSYYGTGGTCRKGTPSTLPEKEKKGKKGGGGNEDAVKAKKEGDGLLKKLNSGAADYANQAQETIAGAADLSEAGVPAAAVAAVVGPEVAEIMDKTIKNGGNANDAERAAWDAIDNSPNFYNDLVYQAATGKDYQKAVQAIESKYKKAGWSESKITKHLDNNIESFFQ